MENKKLKGIKTYNIDVEEELHIYQAYASSVNWMLGRHALSNIELEILSYFLYYNNKYKSIEDLDLRGELLFSPSTKKKIREQFGLNPQRFDNYLNKIKKKGIINNSRILDMFLIYPDSMSSLLFTFSIRKAPEAIKMEQVEDIKFEPILPEAEYEEESEHYIRNIQVPDEYLSLDDLYTEETDY